MLRDLDPVAADLSRLPSNGDGAMGVGRPVPGLEHLGSSGGREHQFGSGRAELWYLLAIDVEHVHKTTESNQRQHLVLDHVRWQPEDPNRRVKLVGEPNYRVIADVSGFSFVLLAHPGRLSHLLPLLCRRSLVILAVQKLVGHLEALGVRVEGFSIFPPG